MGYRRTNKMVEKSTNKKNRRQGTERKAFYNSKKNKYRSTRIEPVLGRDELMEFEDSMVQFSGEVAVKYTSERNKPILLSNVVVNSKVFVDHTWIELSKADQDKLLKAPKGARVYCEGCVRLYAKRVRGMRSQYGLRDVKLVANL